MATLARLRAEAARLAADAPIAGRLELPAPDAGRVGPSRPPNWPVSSGPRPAARGLPSDALEAGDTRWRGVCSTADDPGRPPIAATVVEVEAVGEAHLDSPYLASVFGGPIAVREDDRGRLVPETAVYRVILAPDAAGAPERVVVGTARVEADPVSPIGRLWRTVAAVLIRESGF